MECLSVFRNPLWKYNSEIIEYTGLQIYNSSLISDSKEEDDG